MALWSQRIDRLREADRQCRQVRGPGCPAPITDYPDWDFFERPPPGHFIDRVGVLPYTMGPRGELLFLVGRAWYNRRWLGDFGGTCEENGGEEDPLACLLREVGEELGNIDLDLARRIRAPDTIMLTYYKGMRPPSGHRNRSAGTKHRYAVEFLVYLPYKADPMRGWNGGERHREAPPGPPTVGLGEHVELHWNSLRNRPEVTPALRSFLPYLRQLIAFVPQAASVLEDLDRLPLTWPLFSEYLELGSRSDYMISLLLPTPGEERAQAVARAIRDALAALVGPKAEYVMAAL